ncbi:hypothetical protein C5S42_13150 [Candidatus Methanomarinus sp.]|jgi:hypothetical protein|nr:hypothetical protein C5S42_13150 [ANME-2 cluster archaeon]
MNSEQNPPSCRILLAEAPKELKIRRFVESSSDIPEEWRIRRFVESSPEDIKIRIFQ